MRSFIYSKTCFNFLEQKFNAAIFCAAWVFLCAWSGFGVAASTGIEIQCEDNQLVVIYDLAEGDSCSGERVEIVNGDVTRFPLEFSESRTRPPRALEAGDLVSVNGFLECTSENGDIVSRVSAAAASQNGCAGDEEQTEELLENVAEATASQQDQENQERLLQLQAANDLEAQLCNTDATSDACEASREASEALRDELGI